MFCSWASSCCGGHGRQQTGAPMHPVDLSPFWRSLPYAPTNAQRRATGEICRDLCGQVPMNRLLQGDVGSGKTLVAAAAIWHAAQNGWQSAMLAPTELLARQHAAPWPTGWSLSASTSRCWWAA